MRGPHPAGNDAALGQPRLEVADGFLGTGDHAAAGVVDRGQIHLGCEVVGDGVRAECDGHHDTARRGVHQPGPHRNRLDRGRQIEHAGQCSGHPFADAVAGQRRRADSVGLGQFGQRVLHGEQGGLGPVGPLEVSTGPVEDLGAQIESHLGTEGGCAGVEVLAEHLFTLVQAAGHADVLGTLAGEHEHHAVVPTCVRGQCRRLAAEDVVVLGGAEHRYRVLLVVDHRSHPDRFPAPSGQGVGGVRHADLVGIGQFGRQGGACTVECLGGAGRQQQYLRTRACL